MDSKKIKLEQNNVASSGDNESDDGLTEFQSWKRPPVPPNVQKKEKICKKLLCLFP